MTIPVDLTSPQAGDDPLTWGQTIIAEIESILGSIPGENIYGGSVPKEALASKAAVFAVALPMRSVDTSNVTGFGFVYLPTQDGASRSYNLVGCTITPACGGGTLTATASSTMDVKAVNGSSHAVISTDSISLESANMTANQPFHTGLSRNIASGNYVRVDYTFSGSPDYDNMQVVLWFETEHVIF